MPVHLSSTYVTGIPDNSGWSQVYEYNDPENKEKGSLEVLIGVTGGSNTSSSLARSIFAEIQEKYYKSSEVPLDALKNAIDETTQDANGIECVAMSTIDSEIFCVAFGNAKVALIRGGIYATLLTSKLNEKAALSGRIQSGDIFICGTSPFFSQISTDIMRSSFPTHDLQTLPEFLHPLIQRRENAGCIGAYIIKAEQVQDLQHEVSDEEKIPEEQNEKRDELDLEETTEETTIEVEDKKNADEKVVHTPDPDFLHKKPLYIPTSLDDVKTKKAPILLGVILVVLLVGSIVVGKGKREERLKETAFQNQVSIIEEKLEEAKRLATVNPEVSRQLFQEAKGEVLGLSTDYKPETKNDLENKIKNFQGEVLGEKPVSLDLFVDMSLLSHGFSTSSISQSAGNLYILDRQNSKIAKVTLQSKRAEIIAGPGEAEGVLEITAYSDNVYALTDDEIFTLSEDETVIGDDWENALFYAYASNIYVLDRDSSDIYRYTRGEDAFASKARWMNEDITADVKDVKEMIIDGSIWTLHEDNKILRFTNGTYWEFTPQGVIPELEKVTSIYTDSELEFLYLLDTEMGRLVILSKQGEFKSQYYAEELKTAKKIVASEEQNSFFVITNDKIYKGEL